MDSMKRELEQGNESELFRALNGDYKSYFRSVRSNRMSCLKRIWDGYLRKSFSQYKFYKGIENMGFVMDHLEEPLTREVCSMAYSTSIGRCDLKMSENENIVDVGGGLDSRRNWINCFEDLKMVFFFASLIVFDKVREDDITTEMSD